MLKQTSFPLGKANNKSSNLIVEGIIATTLLLYIASKIYDNYYTSNQNFVKI